MAGSAPSSLLSGLRVILVEDHSLIALDTEMMLRDLGADAVETFTGVDAALTWLATERPDAAILDINLGSTSSFPVAEVLAATGVPFIFTSGYGEDATLPDQFANAVVAAKPYTLDSLGTALSKLLGDPSAH